jgi:predicted alpha/beta superfamily hydrolase
MNISTFGNIESDNILIQMVGEHELKFLEKEVEYIRELAGTEDFGLMAVKVEDWNRDLSPWEAPAVFGDEPFGGRAEATLEELADIMDSGLLKDRDASATNLYIGGYSLSGLFAIWSVYNVNYFKGVAAVSPSVWFPGFYEYISEREIGTDTVYLSLGKKEEKTRNQVMARVGDVIKDIEGQLKPKLRCTLEWNEGNHFKEPELRTAKGFAWLLQS